MKKFLYFLTYLIFVIIVLLSFLFLILISLASGSGLTFLCFLFLWICGNMTIWEKLVIRVKIWIENLQTNNDCESVVKKNPDYIAESEKTPRVNANLWK